MGIQVEFNPDLALREFKTEGRLEEECLPKFLDDGKTHSVLKKGKRKYSKWVFKALLNKRVNGENLWRIDDIVLLPAGLMFKHVSERYGSSSMTRAILSYTKQIQEGKRYGD